MPVDTPISILLNAVVLVANQQIPSFHVRAEEETTVSHLKDRCAEQARIGNPSLPFLELYTTSLPDDENLYRAAAEIVQKQDPLRPPSALIYDFLKVTSPARTINLILKVLDPSPQLMPGESCSVFPTSIYPRAERQVYWYQ